ncbi:hypothetical protein D3C76_1655570 [compost metagenome]
MRGNCEVGGADETDSCAESENMPRYPPGTTGGFLRQRAAQRLAGLCRPAAPSPGNGAEEALSGTDGVCVQLRVHRVYPPGRRGDPDLFNLYGRAGGYS